LNWGAEDDWLAVPDDVPQTLFDTARWAVEESLIAAHLVAVDGPDTMVPPHLR
jgi:hypothetical protein